MSKPANAEQLEIAQRLQQYGAVLVQKPPGTGKTHTIANLLGHFLAEGKSVLVTSQEGATVQVGQELKQRVIRRAKELRQLWAAPTAVSPGLQTVLTGSSSTRLSMVYPSNSRTEQATIPETKVQVAVPVSVADRAQTFDLVSFLKSKKLEIIDQRPQGGSLWVIGGKELAPIMAMLTDRGVSCRHAPSGGRVTKTREAWYLN